ncbi:MAG: ABC transporter ATP-binding protein [Treponema sp.]|nr:ABC transporter ATP-binding protein [Treponema sp.]MCR4630092.1 ABC transporter ATP-binding protein [Treponema sp.]
MMSSIVSIKNLEKTYVSDSETLTVLHDLNLEVEEGSKIAIVGESGSGKSTLLNIISGIDRPTSGSVQAGKWNVEKLSEAAISEYRSTFIGLIFQFHYLLKDFTALENVYMPSLIAGKNKKESIELAKQLLEDVGVADRMNHLPSQLSGGERQRVAAARALINDPQLILADEPTGNLDPANAEKIGELLFSMVEKYQKTLLLVTHDLHLAERADSCLRILEGRLK